MFTIQAVFFDLGDTLVKISSFANNEICKRIGDMRGVPLPVEEYARASHEEWCRGLNSTATSKVKNIVVGAEERERQYWLYYFESLLPRLGLYSEQPELIEWLVDTYTNPKSFVCFDEVHFVLSELREKGLTLGLISNAFPSADRILDHLCLKQYFKYIFLSFELPYAKPESMIYQFAAEKANMAIENIIFVDDRLAFVQGATATNMNAWLIDRSIDNPSITKPLMKKKIEDLRELLQIIIFPRNEIGYNDQAQRLLPAKNEKFWDFCESPINESATSFIEETNHAGRKAAVPAYFSGLTK